jgi:diguanylate cyclase (GGDEF)-like protein
VLAEAVASVAVCTRTRSCVRIGRTEVQPAGAPADARDIGTGDRQDDGVPREEIERKLALHARQHEAVARLGQVALREHDLSVLTDEIVATVARTLDVHLCAVLALALDGNTLEILSSVGRAGPATTLPAGKGTQAGYALATHEPVVAEDLRKETRFDPTPLLAQGMMSGLDAVIEGPDRPLGVLGAHCESARRFSTDDVNFLVAVANVLSAAVERRQRDELARHEALHDPLTGLPNRTLALDRLDLALARRRRDATDVALLLLDLDRFKLINDSLGHAAGDRVLVELSSRLRRVVDANDTLARLSGDEFVVVREGEGASRCQVVALAERICEIFNHPFALASGEHFLSTSVGMAVAEDLNDTSASLLRDADAAMYRAKKRGPGRYELFDCTMRAQALARLRTEADLRRALQGDELCVFYQPIVDLASGRPVANEALVRWMHPRHGLVPPLEFIPIAEETGLIIELGRYVLREACAQAAVWQRQFDDPLQIFVNVSGCQLANPAFPAEVADIATGSGLQEGTLGLEVTESVLIEEAGSAVAVLGELHERATRLVLDDFGTGYSSLSYLRQFPLDSVKVDRSFTDALGDCPRDAAIMSAILQMCQALGLSVVAEGVESRAQLRRLGLLGCELVQGYLLCHPMPAEQVGEFLASRLRSFDLDLGVDRPRSSSLVRV